MTVGRTAKEWLAALLVVIGVMLMLAEALDLNVQIVVGIMLLTFGVRLAIDCGKAGQP